MSYIAHYSVRFTLYSHVSSTMLFIVSVDRSGSIMFRLEILFLMSVQLGHTHVRLVWDRVELTGSTEFRPAWKMCIHRWRLCGGAINVHLYRWSRSSIFHLAELPEKGKGKLSWSISWVLENRTYMSVSLIARISRQCFFASSLGFVKLTCHNGLDFWDVGWSAGSWALCRE